MRLAAVAAASLLAVGGLSAAGHARAAFQHYDLNIPRQSLDDAIRELARQTGLTIGRFGNAIDGSALVGPVSGPQTPEQALRLLLAPQGLTYKVVNDNTMAVVPASAADQDAGPTGSDQVPAGAEETVVVAGSRLNESAKDSPVPTKVYSREQIDSTGAATVMTFLNTLPEVSLQTTTSGDNQQLGGAAVVQLRGLPGGTTLVLIDGRRVSSTSGLLGANGGAFDLNSIPLAAVERIEVIPSGSSAIYGGDALGGVVNIVLKKDFRGVQATATYGMTDGNDYHERQLSLAAGTTGEGWSLSSVLLYSGNSELSGAERALTANYDYSAFGGIDYRSTLTNPGNVCSANGAALTGLSSACAGIPSGSTGVNLTPASFAATDGILNRFSTSAQNSFLSPARRYGAFVHGTYQLGTVGELFTDVLYSHLQQNAYLSSPNRTIPVAADNQNNPFAEDVTVSYRFTQIGRRCYCLNSDFVRPLLGMRGSVGSRWDWEVAGWTTRDWDTLPLTLGVTNGTAMDAAVASGAFNPFAAGAGATNSVLSGFYSDEAEHMRSATDSANGFLRGRLAELPAGTLEGLIGAEYERDLLAFEIPAIENFDFKFQRHATAAFMELKVPVLPGRSPGASNALLTTQFAVRYDDYSDFGSRVSPQAGLVFRPLTSLTLRASYSGAFKPPPMYDVYAPLTTYAGNTLNDPLRGNQSENIALHYGGNAGLRPEIGWSRNIGLVWTPVVVPNLDLTLTQWTIHLKNGFTQPDLGFFVSNASLYPGTVVRSPPVAGDPYGVGPITDVYDLYENIGFIHEQGVDFSLRWRAQTRAGDFTPSLSVNYVYQYDYELDPTLGPRTGLSQANDTPAYAPRWKAVGGLNWTNGLLTLGVTGRYTGPYRDVTDVRATSRELGNFLYTDLNARYEIGHALLADSRLGSRLYVAAGMRNAFNKKPPYADYGYGSFGYDPNVYDIEGRLMWLQAGVRL